MDKQSQIRRIFDHAVQLPIAEREAYVISVSEDEEIRREVLSLLNNSDAAATTYLQRPAVGRMPPTESLIGQRIAEFEVLELVGHGGMGVVYLAYDHILKRQVALKLLAPHVMGSPRAVPRLRQEANAGAAMDHPAIIPVYACGEFRGTHYIVMKYVPGMTLAAALKALEVPPKQEEGDISATPTAEPHRSLLLPPFGTTKYVHQIVGIVATIAEALHHAHQRGVIHRDVKPLNILLDMDANPHLMDFGIAKINDAPRLTSPSQTPGTLEYMSPEQVAASKVDHRTDIFSLGVVLYEALSRRNPFMVGSNKQIIEAICTFYPPMPTDIKELGQICDQALEKNVQSRYQSAGEFAADLRRWLEGRTPNAQPTPRRERVRRWAVSHKVGLVAGALAVMGASVAGLGTLYRNEMTASRRARQVSLHVEAGTTTAVIKARLIDPNTLEPGAAVSLGAAPASAFLETGEYLIEAACPDGRFAQTTVVLLRPGESQSIAVKPSLASASASEEMVLIPGGEMEFGRADGGGFDKARKIQIQSFYIDRAEVSNAEYGAFLRATNHKRVPGIWAKVAEDKSMANRPVVDVTWEDAQAYARWKGKRLPTVYEWEYAMSRPDGKLLPWGSKEITLPSMEQRATLKPASDSLDDWVIAYRHGTRDVRSDPQRAAEGGIFQPVFNVYEFTDYVLTGGTVQVIIKGAAWTETDTKFTVSWNRTIPFESDIKDEKGKPEGVASMQTGFRCARSVSLQKETSP